jgi:hypothetical protein
MNCNGGGREAGEGGGWQGAKEESDCEWEGQRAPKAICHLWADSLSPLPFLAHLAHYWGYLPTLLLGDIYLTHDPAVLLATFSQRPIVGGRQALSG